MVSRVTQKDVAKKLGVSHSTVSLALRGHKSIPHKTQILVKKTAMQLGYSPDPLLLSLSAYRQKNRPVAYHCNIAWINTWPVPEILHQSNIKGYFPSASKRATELGYNLEEVCLADFNHNPALMRKTLLSRGITGLLLPPAQNAGAELKMDFSRFSAVRIGYTYSYPKLFTVANAQFRTSFNLLRIMTDLGYQRVGIFLWDELDDRTAWNFSGGFLTAQQFIPKANRIPPFYYVMEHTERLPVWIKKYRLDGVIALGNVSLILDNCPNAGYTDLDLSADEKVVSGMYQNRHRISISAVNMLTAMMQRAETGIPSIPEHLIIDSLWLPGKTAPRIRPKDKSIWRNNFRDDFV